MRLGELALNKTERVTLDGVSYRMRASFRRVILMTELLRDNGIRTAAKTDRALRLLLTARAYFRARGLDAAARARLLSEILDRLADMSGGTAEGGKGGAIISMARDGEMIYAAFLQCYGIDLTHKGGNIPWRDFLRLLGCVPQGTQLFEVMRIRAEDIPTDNPKYAEQLIRLKRIYSTDENSYTAGLERMLGTLCRTAGREENNG